MERLPEKIALFYTIVVISCTVGCITWNPGWKMSPNMDARVNVNVMLEKTKKLENDADTKEKLQELIVVYESVLHQEPVNRTVLESLARNCFLMAYGYSRHVDEKSRYYVKSIQYAEQALCLNKDFKVKVDHGAKLWESLDVLTRNDMYALMSWYFSAGSYWKECFNVLERVMNVLWVKRFQKIIERMMEIDPTYLHGMPYYLWASFYSGAPSFAGGDLKKADSMFKKAIAFGPTMLNYRRTRALLLYTKTGNREAFVRDMEWILSRNPHKAPLGYPLNVFVQRDAKDRLAAVDRYF